MDNQLTLEQKKRKVQDFRPIDDVFFEVLANDVPFCEELLRTILEDPKLVVNDVIVQSSERNMYGRSVRLDALCTLGNGEKCNIEVQRSDNDDHLKRVRFNASSITVKESQVGDRFEDVAEVYVVYISEFDIFDRERTIYHVENVIRETGEQVDDGLHRIFVNTIYNDGSDIADLMSCFTQKQVNNPKFPVLTRRMNELKNEEGGIKSDLVFYKSGENLWAEDDKDIYEIIGEKNLFTNYSMTRNYLEEKEKFSRENTKFKKTDINTITVTSKNWKDTYTPAFSSSTTSSKICSLYNSKGQGNYGLCWAATVATICNYRKGTNVSASMIADTMNIGYDEGANIYEAQQALKNYGVQYNSVYGNSDTKMPWSILKANIDNKYPIYVSAKATNSGYAVTAYGYTIAAGMKYIVLWNSGINGGKGNPITVSFYEDGTSFSYNNTTYTWTYSVSRY